MTRKRYVQNICLLVPIIPIYTEPETSRRDCEARFTYQRWPIVAVGVAPKAVYLKQ
jgi:hypothetical protein